MASNDFNPSGTFLQTRTVLYDAAGNPVVIGGTGASSDQVQGTSASGAALTGNPVRIGISDGTTTQNVRDASSANATTGTGLLGVGTLGKYSTVLTAVADGQFSIIQTDSRGNLRSVQVQNSGSGFDAVPNSQIGFGSAGGSQSTLLLPCSAPHSFNGTSWDRIRGDSNGQVLQSSLSASQWNYPGVTGGLTTTADTTMMTASAASRNYVKSFQFFNSSAVASEIVIKDGTTTVLWRGRAPASMINSTVVTFDPPLKGSQNTAMVVAMITTATATVVSAQGWQGA